MSNPNGVVTGFYNFAGEFVDEPDALSGCDTVFLGTPQPENQPRSIESYFDPFHFNYGLEGKRVIAVIPQWSGEIPPRRAYVIWERMPEPD